MKWGLLIILISFKVVFSQDTLRHPVLGLGYEDYILFDNNEFQHHSSLCGQDYYSFGTYKKSNGKINFFPDSSLCPESSFEITECDSEKDSLVVQFYDFIDSNQLDLGLTFFFGEKGFKTIESEIKIPKSDILSSTFEVSHWSTTFTLDIPIGPFCDTLKIYVPPVSMGYDCGDLRIRQLKRKKEKYFFKSHVFIDGKKVWTTISFSQL